MKRSRIAPNQRRVELLAQLLDVLAAEGVDPNQYVSGLLSGLDAYDQGEDPEVDEDDPVERQGAVDVTVAILGRGGTR